MFSGPQKTGLLPKPCLSLIKPRRFGETGSDRSAGKAFRLSVLMQASFALSFLLLSYPKHSSLLGRMRKGPHMTTAEVAVPGDPPVSETKARTTVVATRKRPSRKRALSDHGT